MKLYLQVSIVLLITFVAKGQTANLKTPYEKSKGNYTATYEETIAYYELLDKKFKEIQLSAEGSTDIGLPMHAVVISGNKQFDPVQLKSQNKRVVMIMNGIHPGEPEGIDASMQLARDLVTSATLKPMLESVVVVIIPIYNVDGSLMRNSSSRANQNGPISYGFRGNAQNLDLNRDCIKNDSKNARSFAALFRKWQPDVFIDNHTSNGADYQYVMTYIATQKDKLNPTLAAYMTKEMQPALEKDMKNKGFEMSPYVNTLGETPESGIAGFMETPRYSTGYTALFNCIGFVVETHILKPFDIRLKGTYEFLASTINVVHCDRLKLGALRTKSDAETATQKTFGLQWNLDTTRYSTISFKGYKSGFKPSKVSGLPQLYYDTNQPLTMEVKFYNDYTITESVTKPQAYILPQAYEKVINLMRVNRVNMIPLKKDTIVEVETYYIKDYKTGTRPYEFHYLHYGTKVESKVQKVQYRKGDYLIPCNQTCNRYIVETLEPNGVDSFFNWNFFDGILMQKEYFSDYVFEDVAAKILDENPELRKKLEEKQKADSTFAKSQWEQLLFVYKNSPYYEPTHLLYPVGRVLK